MNAFRSVAFVICRRVMCCLSALLLLPASAAWASATCNLAGPSVIQLNIPPIVVARDAAVGSVLSQWQISPDGGNFFSCLLTGGTYGGVLFTGGADITAGSSTGTTTYNGTSFPVYPTTKPGVGVAIGGTARTVVGSASNSTGPRGLQWWSYVAPPSLSSGTSSATGTVIVQLIKTGAITADPLSAMSVVRAYATSGTKAQVGGVNETTPPTNVLTGLGAVSFNIGPVLFTLLTCNAPDVLIQMGNYNTTALPNVNSVSNAVPFNISFNNCPSGVAVAGVDAGLIHSISYRIVPSGQISGFDNVASLSGSPSASGVGIQLRDSSDNVVKFNTDYSVAGFNGAVGGDYTVPLTARYYRTSSLTPGPANTTMTVLVSYL